MAESPLNRKLKKFVILNSSEWLEQVPAVLGDASGNVATGVNGMVYARMTNGQVVTVYNRIAPLIFDLQVVIGRSKNLPSAWQVVFVRENYLSPVADGTIEDHHAQHEYPNRDTVWVQKKQVLSLNFLVSDPVGFKVRVYGGIVRTRTGIKLVENTGTTTNPDLDLSSYIPTAGAVFVNFECDDDGVISLHAGTPYGSADSGTYADIPATGTGKYMLGFIQLQEGMTKIDNDMIGVPASLMTDYDGVDTGFQINSAPADTPLDADKFGFWDVIDATLKSITWANFKAVIKAYADTLYASITHTHSTATRYRQFTYTVSGGTLTFLTDLDGNPIFLLRDLE
jgi:hypothetical protein